MALLALLIGAAAVGAAPPGQWREAAPLPEEAAAELGGKVYVVGGLGPSRALLEYDPATGRWRRRAPVPAGLHHTAAVGVRGRLHVVGGYADGWNPVRSVFEYEPEQDRWRERTAMPTGRTGALSHLARISRTMIRGRVRVSIFGSRKARAQRPIRCGPRAARLNLDRRRDRGARRPF